MLYEHWGVEQNAQRFFEISRFFGLSDFRNKFESKQKVALNIEKRERKKVQAAKRQKLQ